MHGLLYMRHHNIKNLIPPKNGRKKKDRLCGDRLEDQGNKDGEDSMRERGGKNDEDKMCVRNNSNLTVIMYGKYILIKREWNK